MNETPFRVSLAAVLACAAAVKCASSPRERNPGPDDSADIADTTEVDIAVDPPGEPDGLELVEVVETDEGCVLLGDIRVRNSAHVAEIAETGCTVIDGDLILWAEAGTSLAGLERITLITGNLRIYWFDSLDGLAGLEEVGGDFYYLASDTLARFEGLDALYQIGGDLEVQAGPVLEEIGGLSSLEEVAGEVLLAQLPRLNSLAGFSSVDSVGRLFLGMLPALDSLAGLESLRRVHPGGIGILSNEGLADISQLMGLESVAGGLSMSNNPRLPQCQVEALIDHLTSLGWEGEASSRGNLRDECAGE